MQTDFIEAAFSLRNLANKALDEDRTGEWLSLLEMALTSAVAAGGSIPVSVRLQSRAQLPFPVASVDHLVAHISRQGIVLHAAIDLVAKSVCDLRRFPLIGALLTGIAGEISDDGLYLGIIDVSDGNDGGSYPRIAFSSARPDALRIPDPYFFFNDNNSLYRAYAEEQVKPWTARRDVIFWRGGSGGPRLSQPDPANPRDWSCQQRLRLCQAARDSVHRERLDVALSHANTISETYLRDSLLQEGFLKPEVPKLEFFEYRHLIDVDGWTNAWSLLDKMIGGATILKVESAFGYRQWFYERLAPWENYVPIAADLSDFDEIVGWVVTHPKECEEIGANAAAAADETQLLPDLAFAARAALAILAPLPRG